MNPLTRFGRRLSRDAAIYAGGSAITLIISLATVAVLTRYLEPAEFGDLALLLLVAAMLTVIYNLGSLQGSLAWVFGSTGEEEAEAAGSGGAASDKRGALGSALVLTLIVGAAGTCVVAIAAQPLASGLLGGPGDSGLLVVAAGCGALGALWRLVSNVPRLERRPGRFVVLSATRPILVFGASVLLVAGGHGVGGAIVGVAIGSAISTLLGLALIRRSFRLAFRAHHVRRIFALGSPLVPVIVAFWVVQNVDLYVVSRFASADQVGLYKIASRVGGVMSYFVSAFLMAWGPLTLTSGFAAATRERGEPAVGSRLLTYYVIIGLGLVLALVIGADALVKIAPPEYAGASTLVPLLAAGFLAYGGFVALYRATRFPGRRRSYAVMAVASAVAFVGAALVLTPAYGAYGAASAPIVGFLLGCIGIGWLSQRGPDPLPLEWRRLVAAVLLAGACGALGKVVGARLPEWGLVAEVAALTAYPVLLMALGIVPAAHRRALRYAAGGLVPHRLYSDDLARGLRRAAPPDRAALELIVRHRLSPAAVGREISLSQEAIERRFVRGLRSVAGAGGENEDPALARLLLSEAPAAARTDVARELWDHGFDPAEMDQLESAYASLEAAPKKLWRQTRDSAAR